MLTCTSEPRRLKLPATACLLAVHPQSMEEVAGLLWQCSCLCGQEGHVLLDQHLRSVCYFW